MRPLRFGVAGAGHLGYHHARIYHALEGVDLVGVADTDPAKRARAASDFGVTVFEDVQQMLAAGVDAVSVAVPTTAHRDVATACIEAGAHVLIEKPIAPSVEDAEAILASARERQRLVQVGHIERFNGAVLALLDALKAPRFIECHRLSPYPSRGDDVSVVLDLMIHDLDIVCALARSEVRSVDAVGVSVFSGTEDIANARLRFASGCVANITASRVSLEKLRKIRVFADDAYISTDYAAQDVLVYRKKPGAIPPGASPMEHIAIDALPVQREEPLKLELMAFVDAVRNGTRPLVSGEDGLAALQLAELILQAIRSNV